MPAPALVPIMAATAALTLKSDTVPVKVYVKKPRGTLYWGGAGLDGPYIQPQLQAFKSAGIASVNVGLTNTASRRLGTGAGAFVDAVRAGLVIRYEDDDSWVIASGMNDAAPQFNLVGYSYGSLLAAQTANSYARQGHVIDHLVLIASPIDAGFLHKLQANTNIRNVVIINLGTYGDPIFAGIGQTELIEAIPTLKRQQDRNLGEGHFYYAHVVKDSPKRWAELAAQLADAGLR